MGANLRWTLADDRRLEECLAARKSFKEMEAFFPGRCASAIRMHAKAAGVAVSAADFRVAGAEERCRRHLADLRAWHDAARTEAKIGAGRSVPARVAAPLRHSACGCSLAGLGESA